MPGRYLVSLDLEGRRCVVVGGGPVALRKARDFVDCGASVRVVAPEIDPGFTELPNTEIVERRYEVGDLDGAWLVIAATDDAAVNDGVVADADASAIWSSAADRTGGGPLASVARRTRGRLTVGVSSDGASPALARWLAEDLVDRIDPRTVSLAEHLHNHRYSDPADPITGAVRAGRVAEALDLVQAADS